ncbi:MAG TPA: universal stress protein [Alphaproteobacteria bacterium]|nr:universal stress protein [Alphaproteobacteria bacterium]
MKEATIELIEEKPRLVWKKILVPIDFSELSKQAIKAAVFLAKQFNAKIILLHVVDLSNVGSVETGIAVYELMESARRSLDELVAEIPTTLIGEKIVCLSAGGVSQKIVETARRLSSDLIVLASHAYGFFKRLFLGSTTEGVNRYAPCEVLVLRQKPINQ